jgi:hypothetical protein
MDSTTLNALHARKTNGEKVKTLAAEAGVSTQKLVAEWRKAGLTEGAAEPAPAEGVVERPAPEPEPESRAAERDDSEAYQRWLEAHRPAEPAPTPSAEKPALPADDETLVSRPVTTVAFPWRKYALLDGKDGWATDRQLAGLRFVLAGRAVPGDLLRQLAKKGWAAKVDGRVVATDEGRRVAELFARPGAESLPA